MLWAARLENGGHVWIVGKSSLELIVHAFEVVIGNAEHTDDVGLHLAEQK